MHESFQDQGPSASDYDRCAQSREQKLQDQIDVLKLETQELRLFAHMLLINMPDSIVGSATREYWANTLNQHAKVEPKPEPEPYVPPMIKDKS